MLGIDTTQAIDWFNSLVQTDDELLATPHIGHFIHYAGRQDYLEVQPVLLRMLKTEEPKAVEAAATQACLLALNTEEAKQDAEFVRNGNEIMRKAAADVYATNAAHQELGTVCRAFLKPLFLDPSEEVRTEAASVFRKLPEWNTQTQADMLSAFLASQLEAKTLCPVVRAVKDSPVQLPDLVCDLAERCINAYGTDGGDIRTGGASVAHDLSKIVVRLYSQTQDEKIQTRCLDLVDRMEQYNFYGLAQELESLDR